jgi:hypothetical protein
MHALAASKGQNQGGHLSRRVSSSSSSSGEKAAATTAVSSAPPALLKPVAEAPSSVLQLLQPPPRSEKSSSFSKRRAKHNDSPDPLLSKVPVDDWFGKTVRIMCGPLLGKVGTVDRWGNGWITVIVPGVGGHNRRSFELCVVDDGAGDDAPADDGKQRDSAGTAGRAVERDRSTVSPSPSSEGSSGSSTSATKAASKGPGEIVHKVSYSYDGEEATPRPGDPGSVLVLDATPQADRSVVATTAAAAGRYPGHHQQAILEAHKITPVSPRKAMAEVPLSESLAMAREAGAKKYRIDMLFGTAALERGRRSVHLRLSPPSPHRGGDPGAAASAVNNGTAAGG